MSKILEMIEKRTKAWEGAKAFVESKKDKDGLLSEEDAKTYQAMEDKILNYTAEIDRLRRMEDMERELEKPINSPITDKPNNNLGDEEKEIKPRERKEYKKAMLNAIRSNFRKVDNILQESVDTDGGYLVPEEYDTRLIQTLEEENIVRKLANVIKTSGERKINIAATDPAAAWIEEGGALSFGDSKFEQVLLDAHKLHVAIKVTEELLYDSAFNLESYILDSFGKALSNAEEDAFLNGDGVGKPTGIFDKTNGGTKHGNVTAIKTDDLIDLVYALKRPYRKNAAFILNDKVIASIRKLKDTNGAYIWQPSYQVGEPDSLLGYPVYTSAFAPEKAIAFGDFSYYNIGDRGTRSFQELRELFAGNGMVGYVAKERVDGKLILKEAVQILAIGSDV
ncbi:MULTISPECIES: phage major capsid protein [Helcococcus]|uniref:Phage major capsid protein n=1 Tax=Helcococcus bovis TaxID=3153252 RepID=A0ABW9F5T5_9FIRM